MPIDKIRRRTDRLRPEVALGGIAEDLSLPQHDVHKEADAVQKHQPKPAATQPMTFPCILV